MFSGSPTFDAFSHVARAVSVAAERAAVRGHAARILVVHEFGHYFTARARGAASSLPYFIPARR